MKTIAVIQARMGSTRLPDKVMRLVDGKPLIGYLLERVTRAATLDKIVLATSQRPENDSLAAYARSLGVAVFRGSEDDVLDRFYQAARANRAGAVVRITGDCPLMDPAVIDRVVKVFQQSDADYASNVCPPTFPDGMDVEVMRFAALERAWAEATQPSHREHVTLHLREAAGVTRCNVTHTPDLSDRRWTVDGPEDYLVIAAVLERLYPRDPGFDLCDILRLEETDPRIFAANRHIERNAGLSRALAEEKAGHQS